MFSTRAYIEKKTGPHGIGRFNYLQSLVTEFQDSDSNGTHVNRRRMWAIISEIDVLYILLATTLFRVVATTTSLAPSDCLMLPY